jgi:type IV secretion system protein VirD4
MYQISRVMLALSVVLFGYCIGLATILAIQQQVPPENQSLAWAILIVGIVIIAARKKGRRLFTAFGTAAWASPAELQGAGMIGTRKGLILGRVPSEGTPLGQAIKALFNRRLTAADACHAFSNNLKWRTRKQGQLVRLPQAVHTAVFAPTGVGKGVSCIIPFLLTCDESCVVVDFKGENALLTAERRRRMGHKIVILDPFKVVTQ